MKWQNYSFYPKNATFFFELLLVFFSLYNVGGQGVDTLDQRAASLGNKGTVCGSSWPIFSQSMMPTLQTLSE